MTKDNVEQRINLKFLARLKHTGKESYDMLKEVYGDECMSRSQVFEWHKRFRDGQEEVTDIERSGRPATVTDEENVEKVRQILRENPSLSIRAIARILGIANGSVQRIVKQKIWEGGSGSPGSKFKLLRSPSHGGHLGGNTEGRRKRGGDQQTKEETTTDI